MARRVKSAGARLEAYRSKRDFAKTPEPPPTPASTETGRSFVVQQHAARRMHWDFRLELDGVLLSWAVPKGPSLDPKERRLAVRTEDHPVEYGTFEGTIPKGEYGGGTVLLWDRGTWTPEGDPHAALEKGHLTLTLEGQKMHGRWHLVRTRGEKAWLLIKGKDEHARPGDGDRMVRMLKKSVASGRTLDAITRDPDRVWHSEEEVAPPDASGIAGTKARAMPDVIAPELATLFKQPPEGDDWLHEIKLDGYRILARVERGNARLFTRNANDWTARLPTLARVLRELPVERAWLDGEIVVMDARGRSDFGALQDALAGGRDGEIRYVIFDLLYLGDRDLRGAALADRKKVLRALLSSTGALEGRLRFSDHVRGNGARFYAEACRLGLEGIVSKHAARPYVPRRTKDWRKVKCFAREEAVVVGFSEPSGSRSGLGALLLGQHEGGELRYVGKVGTGFDTRTLEMLRARLEKLEVSRPAAKGTPRGAAVRRVHWVRPELVVEVTFSERTKDDKLRHPVFVGVREDKPAASVTPERPAPEERPARRAKASAGDVVAGVKLSHPDKVFYPDLGVTKRELAEYYVAIADHVVPHVASRPLTLVRCPDGIAGPCFYMQHAFRGMPRAIHRVRVRRNDEALDHTYVRDIEGVVALVQFGSLELHTWCARHPKLETPDILVFDLDPGPGVPWDGVAEAAFAVRERTAALGLTSFVKTTGGKGLHVVVPIVPKLPWEATKAFAHGIARDLVHREPSRYTATITKAKRKGKVYIDYVRNTRGATAVAAYSTRAKKGAPVSTPIRWEELARGIDPAGFDVRTVRARMARLRRDPWEGFEEARKAITPEMRAEVGTKE